MLKLSSKNKAPSLLPQNEQKENMSIEKSIEPHKAVN